MNPIIEIILLFGAGLIAGALNSLAGGGSFISFPALLLAGVPPVLANATNTFASWPGYVSGTVGYWTHIRKNKRQLVPYIVAATVGGYAGAELLLRVNDAQFEVVVPWLMAMAVFLFAFGGRINDWIDKRSGTGAASGRLAGGILLIFLTLICLYGGFFNAGLGIILLAFFALAGVKDIHAMNGMKLLLSAIVASVAIIRFALSGSIAWYQGSLVFVGSMVGGYVAARLAKYIPTKVLNIGIIIYGIVLTLVFFWQAYGG